MKIIKEGKKTVATMEVTCRNCEAVLEVQNTDLKYLADTIHDKTYYKYTCPCCNRINFLTRKEMTKEILAERSNKTGDERLL